MPIRPRHNWLVSLGLERRGLERGQSARAQRLSSQISPQRLPQADWAGFALLLAMMAISTVTITLVVSAAMATPVHPERPPALIPATALVQSISLPEPREASPVLAQQSTASKPTRIRRRDMWKAVQEQLPDLPREDQYGSEPGGDGEPSTLSKRLIEYHSFRKGRSPISRFDWKLTLGDYLGINEPMVLATYPGSNSLVSNPLAGDRAAIRSLSPAQRDRLVNVLVRLHNPNIPDAFFDSSAEPPPEAVPPTSAPPGAVPPAPAPRPNPFPLPQPGDADLLRPR